MGEHYHVSWEAVRLAADLCADRWAGADIEGVIAVPRGGFVPAAMVADRLGVPLIDTMRSPSTRRLLMVDDLVDSGATAQRWLGTLIGARFDALFRKPTSPVEHAPKAQQLDGWLVFPWEHDEQSGPTDNVRRLLQHIGEDPDRDGLRDTPARVVKAWGEMTEGYRLDPRDVLARTFDIDQPDELILVSGIEFASLCEHHVLPFTGTAVVGYLPGKVVGLSKLARLVDLFARRLQVQERLTEQIATALVDHLDAQAAGVIIDGHHSCMGCRGVRKTATMTTSAMLGRLRTDPAMRAEFLSLAGR